MLLAITSFLYGPYLIKRWKEEKRAERLSAVAEEALNYLDLFKFEIDIWLKFANAWFVYNRHSKQDVQGFAQLPENEKKKLANEFNNDKYEVHNYCKEAYQIIEGLCRVKYKARRLSNQTLVNTINELEEIVKRLPDSLFDKHFPVADVNMKEKAEESFKEASEKVEIFYTNIHSQLLKISNFKNKIR